MKFTTANGYMTLKIALPPTEITRTIVVPECMTMTDLNCAIQSVMGWQDSHLWCFQEGRDGPIYELSNEDGDAISDRHVSMDADDATLGRAFPSCGSELTYEYDFGDSWIHIVTRMSNPKTAEIACVQSTGPDGIEDFGGQCHLAAFIDAMRKNPKDEKWTDTVEWCGYDDPDRLREYLAGESAAQKTVRIREALAHVRAILPTKGKKPKKMSEEEQANLLGVVFATMLPACVWELVREALKQGGTCEFVDHDKTISPFLTTMFDGVKIKHGVQTASSTRSRKMTVPKKWVEFYSTHAKEWAQAREPFDILESYAHSVVHLYGAMEMTDFYKDILHRYDPGIKLSLDEVTRYLKARAHWRGIGYRIDGDVIVDDVAFSSDREDSESDVDELLEIRKDYPRWHPADRSELFLWENAFVPDGAPEVDQLELVIRSLGSFDDEMVYQIVDAVIGMIATAIPPEVIYASMVRMKLIEKFSTKRRKPLFDAIERCSEIVRMQCFNGNTIREVRALEAAKASEPKISRNAPCPCGSGKKYKMCCGKGK